MSFVDAIKGLFGKSKEDKPYTRPENCELRTELLGLERNAINMMADAEGKVLYPDSSKIGGRPYLPADFEWPEYKDKNDGEIRPLSFFCQLNLSELSAYDRDGLLPERGILSFFYECESFCWGFDPEDKGAARVFYYENTEGFVPTDIPQEIDSDYVMPEMPLSFEARKAYPMFEEFDVLSDIICDCEDYDRLVEELGGDVWVSDRHKILGYADIIQNEMLSECEMNTRGISTGTPENYKNLSEAAKADICEKEKEWVLLLQLSTIETDDFCWMFGDGGMLYYYIRKEDLANRRFENTWFSLQCG